MFHIFKEWSDQVLLYVSHHKQVWPGVAWWEQAGQGSSTAGWGLLQRVELCDYRGHRLWPGGHHRSWNWPQVKQIQRSEKLKKQQHYNQSNLVSTNSVFHFTQFWYQPRRTGKHLQQEWVHDGLWWRLQLCGSDLVSVQQAAAGVVLQVGLNCSEELWMKSSLVHHADVELSSRHLTYQSHY